MPEEPVVNQTEPSSKPSIDPAEYEKLKSRAAEYDAWQSNMSKHEIDSLSDDDLLLLQSIRRAKVPHKDIIGAVSTYEDDLEKISNEPSSLTNKQIQEMIDKRSEELLDRRLTDRERMDNARYEHQRLLAAQEQELSEIRKELGVSKVDEDDPYGQLLEAAIVGLQVRNFSKRGFYPNDHPLSGTVRPLTKEDVREIRDSLSKATAIRDARKQLQDAKKAVRTPKSGVTDETKPNTDENKTPEEIEHEKIEALMKARFAQRQASAVSTSV